MTAQDEPLQNGPAENNLIIGRLVRLNARALTPGSIQNRCGDCGDAVWLSPSSMIEDGKVICCVCFAKLMQEDDKIKPRTNDLQRKEIKDAGVDVDPVDAEVMRGLIAWECFMAQSPRDVEDFKSDKFFWAFAKRLKAGTVGLARTDGISVKKVYAFPSTEAAFKGLESIFIDGKDAPEGGHLERG